MTTNTLPSVSDWFCLKSGKKNFSVNPQEDNDILFGDSQWREDIDKRLKRSIAMNWPLRLVWWGQYGIGKTHRLRYTSREIEKKQYAFHPCYVITADLVDDSGFEVFNRQLLESHPLDAIRKMTEDYMLRLNTGQSVKKIEELAVNAPSLVQVIKNFGSQNSHVSNVAWNFLLGNKLDDAAQQIAGASKPQLDNSVEYATIHSVFGHIVKTETDGKTLVYLIDEAENLGKIKHKKALPRWTEGLRMLLDVEDVGLIFTVGAENNSGLPAMLLTPENVRRVQTNNYVELPSFDTPAVSDFVKELLARVVDRNCLEAKKSDNNWTDGVDGFETSCYPFESRAFDMFCDVHDPRNSKPSEILERLNSVAYEAMDRSEHLITPAILNELGVN